MPLASWILIGLAALGVIGLGVELMSVWVIRRRSWPTPARYPSFSIIKPLCGLDDELLENLQSHVAIDYPGEYEVLLGVRDRGDAAYPIARRFAEAHPGRVRVVVQQGEPGHNPKVNQLITLTREARYEFIALTDSNVRVPASYLREHAAVLADPKIGLSTHLFAGAGELRLGAVFDNLTLASFCTPSIAAASVALGLDQIVGKSIALRREVLKELGGWHEVKDVLAEDQRMGIALRKMGLRTAICPTPVINVQRNQSFSHFWGRHTRWSMIRFRVLVPGVFLEPLANTFVLCLAAALIAWNSPLAWALAGGSALFSIAYSELAGRLTRGDGFKLQHLLWVPVRDVALFLAWLRGSTMRWVTWRGNRLHVLAKTRLAQPDALARARKMHRIGR